MGCEPMFRPLVTVIAALLTLSGAAAAAADTSAPSPPPVNLSAWPGVSWSRVGALPKGVDVSALAAWGAGYILVGADQPDRANRQQGGVWHSTDLTAWSRVVTVGGPDDTTSLTMLLALPAQLVALGAEQPAACIGSVESQCDLPRIIAWTSADGVEWDELTLSSGLGTGTVADIAAGPDQALAVGDQGWDSPSIWRSSDGLRWEVEALPAETFADAHLFGVTAFAGGWVVTGMTGGKGLVCCDATWMVDETRPAAWWTADGLAWQRAEVTGGASEWGARLGDVFAGPGGLVAVDEGTPVDIVEPQGSSVQKPQVTPGRPQVWTSTDGTAWTSITVDPETAFRPIASDGMAILGRSTHGGLAVSTDGTTWRALNAAGNAPGTKTPMDWGYMRPAWLVPDGLLAVGLDAHGGPTRRLMLAAATTSTAPAGSGSP